MRAAQTIKMWCKIVLTLLHRAFAHLNSDVCVLAPRKTSYFIGDAIEVRLPDSHIGRTRLEQAKL